MHNKWVLLLFFDFSVKTKKEQSFYRKFIKHIKNNGFIFFQESIYVKLLSGKNKIQKEIENLSNNVVLNGEISVLPLSLLAFKNIKTISGTGFDISLFSDEFLFL